MVILLQVLMVTKHTGTDGYWLYSYTVTGTDGYQTHRY